MSIFSAEVQGKHIALLKEQFGILGRENTQLSSENAVLKAEVNVLKSEKEHLTKENEILRSKVKEYEQSPHNNLPDKVKVDILVALSKREQTITEHLARLLSIGVETARFHLHELRKSNMVIDNATTDDEGAFRECWELEHEGRRLLVENNLIS